MDPSGGWSVLGEGNPFAGWYPAVPNVPTHTTNVEMQLRSPFLHSRALELANLEAIIEFFKLSNPGRQWRDLSNNALFLEASDEAEYWQWRHPNWYLSVVSTPATTSPLLDLWLSKTAYRRIENWVENFDDIARRLNGPFPMVICGEITSEALDLALPSVLPGGHLLLRWNWDLRYDEAIVELTERLIPLFRKIGLVRPICGQDWWLVCYEASFLHGGVTPEEIPLPSLPSLSWKDYCFRWAEYGEKRHEIPSDPRLLRAWDIPSPLPKKTW
jgi:hypothetical protein